MTPTNTASTLYSVFRNAIAPALIRAAICCMRSVPASRRLMPLASTKCEDGGRNWRAEPED